jgi:hypothetical protein
VANVVLSAIATFNGKGLTKGQKQVKSFEKSVKSLGRTFGYAFTAAGIVNFSKKAIAAFAADEAAAKSLEMQLKNTGYAFSAPDVEFFIANLQKLYGVLDDQLRPAFQTLLTSSGSIVKSQKALTTALNVSAATGKSVEEVSAALAKGFSGQTTALTRLGAGLSKATIATGDMGKIMDELDAKFAGQAASRLTTYAGKMDQLKVASASASEIIGGSLLDSLSLLSNDNSLSGFSNLLTGLATKLAALDAAVFGFVAKVLGRKQKTSNFTYSLGSGAGVELAKIQEKKKIKESIALRTQENNQLKAKTAVDKLKDQFDLERIGLTAALNSATDEETKLRIKAQLAILDNNEALAKKYLAEMAAAEAARLLAESMKKSAEALEAAFQATIARLKIYDPIAAIAPGQGGFGGGGGGGGGIPSPSMTQAADYQSYRSGERATNITLELAPNTDTLGQLFYDAFLINQRDGKSQLYNGGIKGG